MDMFKRFTWIFSKCPKLPNYAVNRPWQFPSEHSQFVYFQKAQANPYVIMFDDTRCDAIPL
jgi:hypothetical protein